MNLDCFEPGDFEYDNCLSNVFNGEAAASHPKLILQPKNEEEVSTALRLAVQQGLSVSVLGGGHSRFCAADDQIMLDLSANMNCISLEGDRVRIQGGASMGMVLSALAAERRMIPAGTHPTPGFGLLTMGGIGHLSRSLGLTIDSIHALSGVRPDGEKFRITSATSDQELWVMMRGGALFLAVITEAEVNTYPRNSLSVFRSINNLEKLSDVITLAENLDNHVSCSLILAVPADHEDPCLLIYAVSPEVHQDLLQDLADVSIGWVKTFDGLESLPEFNMPLMNGTKIFPEIGPIDRHKRVRTWSYSISLPAGCCEKIAIILEKFMCKLPNNDCRIDLQHIGGVVSDVHNDQTLYRGRGAEWSIVITACWPAQNKSADKAARAWVDELFKCLTPMAVHYYIVERHPETEFYDQELKLAFGPWLDRIRQRKLLWDPKGILPSLR